MTTTSMLHPDERLDLLVRLLRFGCDIQDIGRLRIEMLSDMSSFDGMIQAAARRQLLPAAISQLRRKGILPKQRPRPGATSSIPEQLAGLDEQFRQRRTALGSALQEIIRCLNRSGIKPIVLKGSMSLISGEPEWRFQRDIDIAVDPAEADATVSVLQTEGFRERDDMEMRPHHLRPMERDDVPALIEPHIKLAGTRARTVLPDDVLMSTVRHHVWNGLDYRAMSNTGFLLHGLAHHWFQNRGFIYGTVSLKGLLEFAHSISGLKDTDVLELEVLTAGHPRLKAGLLLWCALSDRLLGVTLPTGVITHSKEDERADIISNRYLRGETVSPLAGIGEHIALTLRYAPKTLLVPSVLPPILDGCHRAVWRDHERQRRNASGILGDD